MAAAPSIEAFGATVSDLDATIRSHQSRLLGSAAPVNISYFTDAPCPVKPIPHRRAVKRHRLVHHVVHRHVHHRRRRPLLHKAALPARCEILHRDRLFSPVADAGPAEAVASEPAAEALAPAGPEVLDAGGGDGPAGFVASGASPGEGGSGGVLGPPGGSGGGSTGGGSSGGPGGSPSGAPEPDAWLLMILGAAVAGAGLRRRQGAARGCQMASLGRS